jgi:hypothetical protein
VPPKASGSQRTLHRLSQHQNFLPYQSIVPEGRMVSFFSLELRVALAMMKPLSGILAFVLENFARLYIYI